MSDMTNWPLSSFPSLTPAVQSPSVVLAKSQPRTQLIRSAGNASITFSWSGLNSPPSAGEGLCMYCPENTYGLALSMRRRSSRECFSGHRAVPFACSAGKQTCSHFSPLPPSISQPDRSLSCNLCMIRITGVCGLFLRLSSVFWNHSMTLARITSERASSGLCGSSIMIQLETTTPLCENTKL